MELFEVMLILILIFSVQLVILFVCLLRCCCKQCVKRIYFRDQTHHRQNNQKRYDRWKKKIQDEKNQGFYETVQDPVCLTNVTFEDPRGDSDYEDPWVSNVIKDPKNMPKMGICSIKTPALVNLAPLHFLYNNSKDKHEEPEESLLNSDQRSQTGYEADIDSSVYVFVYSLMRVLSVFFFVFLHD